MRQLVAVILEADVDAVTRALLDEGVMHFINVSSIAGEAASQLRQVGTPSEINTMGALRKRIESLLKKIGVTPYIQSQLDLSNLRSIDTGPFEKKLSSIEQEIDSLSKSAVDIDRDLKQAEDMERQFELYGDLTQSIRAGSSHSYLSFQMGAVPADKASLLREAVASMPVVVVDLKGDEAEQALFLVGLKREEKAIEKILDECGWRDLDLRSDLSGVEHGVSEDLESQVRLLRDKRAGIEERITELIRNHADELVALWETVRINELYSRIQSFFSRTERTILFTGWVPADSSQRLDSRIQSTCASGCYLEWHDAAESREGQDDTVPVQLRNPRFLKPFEMIVSNYAIPAYGSVDPTPLVGIAYLTMFGLMFGDAGHGFVLVLLGLIGKLLYRKQNNVRHLLTLLTYCGCASVITGILFGSYFGFRLFPPLWFDYHGIVSGHGGGDLVSSVYDVLAITIYFGISVIGLGLLLNWINLTAKRNWFELIFDKAGILGGILYGAGIWATRFFVTHDYKTLPEGSGLIIFFGIPVILLAFKSPIRLYIGPSERFHPMMIVDFIMDWIVEILEIFSGYLANTLSFMRVAGLGIAHEALLIAFFQIARSSGGGSLSGLWAILILVAGNILIIGLEGLSAGIQSLRLNYYEFFSKYFSGTGRRYAPVSLRDTIP